MGGGGSNSSPPVDVAPGGGTYPVDSFGNAYNPSWGGGFNWGTLGQGFQRAGSSIVGSVPQGNYMQPASAQQAAPFNVAEQGEMIGLDKRLLENNATQSLIEALRRIEATAKSQKKDVMLPEMGAGKYMYVDPRAQQSTNMGALGLLPEGTQPSF